MPEVIEETGVAPAYGVVTPEIAVAEMVVLVAGKTAVMTPELMEL